MSTDYWSDDNKTRVGDDDYSTRFDMGHLERVSGRWHVTFRHIPNVAYGSTYTVLSGNAVHDDFGVLVMVSDEHGRVVLQ